MHELERRVRFSVNPFLDHDPVGANSYASKPTGTGLAIFFDIGVVVEGPLQPKTGFVINVLDIDKLVRNLLVPVFAARVRKKFRTAQHIGLPELGGMMLAVCRELDERLETIHLHKIDLKLNPFRRLTVNKNEPEKMYLSEKFEFAATHKLWNDQFSEEKNFEVFGKCANPAGHGHNYTVEITVELDKAAENFRYGEFEEIVDRRLVKLVDHKNLNVEVKPFDKTNPTVENIAAFAWGKLVGKLGRAKLNCVTVWEAEKTCCRYYG